MKIQHLTAADAFASLNSRASGLDDAEAARRLAEFGKNKVVEIAREPLILTFAKEFVHFFAIILWIAAALAFFAEWNQPGQGMATLGFAIIGVIVINGVFSFWQAYRAEQALAVLKKLLPHSAKILRSGNVRQLAAAELVPGDVILLEAGDILPADCRLVEAFGVRVNNATITGESLPSSRDAEPCDEAEIQRSSNILLAGTSLVSGEAKALVFATGAHSAFGRIATLTQDTGDTVSPLQTEILGVSRIVAGLALSLGVIFFFVGRAIGLSFWENFIFAIGIIVANVPEGLLPTVTLSLAMASQRMARRNALIRHLPAVETLGCTTVICTDKTGTLTQNRMFAKRLFIGGSMFEPGSADLPGSYRRFFEVAALCHDLKKTDGGWLGDPMEIALVQLAESSLPSMPDFPRISEIPFDSQKRRLSTIHASDDGPVLFCKGAPEVVLTRCNRADIAGETVALPADLVAGYKAAAELMGKDGLRVLAFAWRSRNFLTYILTSNVPEIIPYLAFVILRIPLPLTIIQILAVDLGTDMLPALGLGAERPGPDIMNAPPRPRTERLLNGGMLARAYLFLGPMQATAAMCAYAFVLHHGAWKYGQPLAAHAPLYLQATTACLSAIVVMQVANVFLCRSARLPLTRRGLFNNKLILAGVAAEIAIILLIDYTAWGNALLGTAPISAEVWLFIVPFALAMVMLEEFRKWICRMINRRRPPGWRS